MFAPAVIAAREAHLVDTLRDVLPAGLTRHPHAVCWEYVQRLASAVDAKGRPTRPLTAEEAAFVTNERLLLTLDFRYIAERYAVIAKESQEAEPIFPLWASQELFLAHLAAQEQAHHDTGNPDGILMNVLKARQLGISSITEVILALKAMGQTTLRGLVAADVPEQSSYMLGMAELVVDHFPWWLTPPVVAPTNKGAILSFGTGSSLRVAAGKSQRGSLQDRGGTKGNIGRGKTWGALHLSELSTWERAEQINDALLPGVPVRPRTFGIFESTAKGRHDWWHSQWTKTTQGLTRFGNIFIPWYIEPDKYWRPAPPGWTPDDATRAHVAAVEQTSPQYLLGRTVRLSREQAYWYETTRRSFEADDRLHQFLEEYPATPEEAFQHAGRSIFSAGTLARLHAQARPPVAIVFVEPAKDVALLQAWERDQATARATEEAAAVGRPEGAA